MKIKLILSFIFVFALAFLSCNRATPAGFWRNFNSAFLINSISDQGPYGGHRALHWKANTKNVFSPKQVIQFATKNDWRFTDSLEFSEEKTSRWIYNNCAVFPLTSKGFSDSIVFDSKVLDFPRWFEGRIKVYRFKTGWITIEPGTDKSIEENGFVAINEDKSEMAVYHLWGE